MTLPHLRQFDRLMRFHLIDCGGPSHRAPSRSRHLAASGDRVFWSRAAMAAREPIGAVGMVGLSVHAHAAARERMPVVGALILGHAHPQVVAAVQEAAARYLT